MSRNILIQVVIIVIILILLGLSVVLKVPYTINSRGVVYPAAEWTLSKTTGGQLINQTRDNRTNSIVNYSVTEFMRGDASSFALLPSIYENPVKKGDTMGYIYSNEDRFRLAELEGQLTAEENMYKIYTTGEKDEIISYYEEVAGLALVDWESQKQIFARIEKLFNDSLIPKNEYDIALNELKLKEHTYRIAVSNINTFKTGAKDAQVNLSRSMIESYQFQIAQLKEKIATQTITAPFDGRIIRQKKANYDVNGNVIDVEEIVKLVDISSLLVVLPIEFYESGYIKTGMTVDFGENKAGAPITGTVIDIDNTVQILKRRQVLFITVEVTDNIDEMLFSMFVDGTIDCGSVKLYEYILRIMDTVTEN
jgi:hypothetical protein